MHTNTEVMILSPIAVEFSQVQIMLSKKSEKKRAVFVCKMSKQRGEK